MVEERFRAVVEWALDAIVIVGPASVIIFVNHQAESLFGYKREEMLGKSIEILIPMRFRAKHHDHTVNYLSDPRIRPMGDDFELYGLRKDGSEFPAEISLNPLETRGGETLCRRQSRTSPSARPLALSLMMPSKTNGGPWRNFKNSTA